jgi:hypothetical protein
MWGSSPRGAVTNDSKRWGPVLGVLSNIKKVGVQSMGRSHKLRFFVDVGLAVIVAQAIEQTGRRHVFLFLCALSILLGQTCLGHYV